jgi:GTP-binding protein
VGTQPPTLVLVCNDPKAFSTTYRRYLLGVLRDQLSFGEVPFKLYLKRRATTDTRDQLADELAEDPGEEVRDFDESSVADEQGG